MESGELSINTTEPYSLPQAGYKASEAYTVIMDIIYCTLAVLNTPLNSSVIYLIMKQKKMNPSHMFILSLSVSNLLVVLPVLLFPIRMHVPLTWTLVQVQIVLSTWPAFAATQSAMLTILSIAIDRLLAVARPLTYRRTMTSRLALTMTSLTWTYALVATGVAVIYYGTTAPHDVITSQSLTISQWIPVGFWLTFTFVIYGCVMATVVIYIIIFVILKRSTMEQSSARTKKITRTTGLMVAMVIVTWLPLHVFGYVVTCCPHYYEPVYYSLHALLMTNTIANPIIFLRQNKSSSSSLFPIHSYQLQRHNMDKEVIFELFRVRCMNNIMHSLDQSLKDEQAMFKKAVAYVQSSNFASKSVYDRRLALACIHQYFVGSETSIALTDADALKGILLDLKENCQGVAREDEERKTKEKRDPQNRNSTNTFHT
ncbi:hypothetical protein CAPTEDRAFT_186436 [Capitella teleta]|uniref:G-protein coupled receptors family 1 profile domain-containing protein n=1 Tax=Capitella teleta TaxID=283909 RepID=R7TA02_CAPTE|nr:hypothetical protein CAPTEDRAFT_186436 [Capitella teleta]|eukprot:ELT88210.1 hypothetical protein CAPTEDRAFT_186436 [Capitella teleta]